MRVVSLSVGRPREVEWHGRTVLTSIFKAPVDRRLRVTTLNFEGDEQSDLSVHGGVDKAVYVYPSEHYELWRRELPQADLPWGVFGENLTTEGLLEAEEKEKRKDRHCVLELRAAELVGWVGRRNEPPP